MEDNTDLGQALRTRRLPQKVREALTADFNFDDADAIRATTALFGLAGITLKNVKAGGNSKDADNEGSDADSTPTAEGELQGDQLTFTTDETAQALAIAVAKHRDAILDDDFKPNKLVKDELLAPFSQQNTIIALCGRMLAALPGTNVDGALQVAHAFTTHASNPDLDYFTAVDDEIQDDDEETGAGHINVNEFTSGVFYRHATVGLGLLSESLDESDEAVAEAAAAFVRAFTLAEPTGKQNAANAHTRPALVAITLRSDRPVSLATAFEEPVAPKIGGGYMAESITKLDQHAAAGTAFYGDSDLVEAWHAVDPSSHPGGLSGLGTQCSTFDELVRCVEQSVRTAVS